MRTRDGTFSGEVQAMLRSSGYSQQELAKAISLNPKVLSRKLNGHGNSHLTHLEIRAIITVLAQLHAITKRNEVMYLLELAKVGATLFDEEAWSTPPLSQLEVGRSPFTSNVGIETSVDTPRHNLPAPYTRFIGREWAVERLYTLFEQKDIRLVSLVGPGGSGKTCLACHVAQQVIDVFTHGVWLVSLAGVTDAAFVPMSIAQVLGIKPTPGMPLLPYLCTYLRNKHMLLVLDNFEQVSEAAYIIGEMLNAAPLLRVLVTSRTMLHVYGEHKLIVPTLDMPAPDTILEVNELIHYEAVQLFLERVRDFVPDFALTDENKESIVQICAKLDGLPLSLELAAARMKVLSPELLLERLSNAPLSVLTGGARNLPIRHRTLRDTIEWSYNLLSAEEKMWFSRFGIFSGGWSLNAAEAMARSDAMGQEDAATSNTMLDLLGQLVDNNLLVRMPDVGKQPRFTMLEMLREYAREMLASQGQLEQWQDWHACSYLQLVEAAELGLRGARQCEWLAWLTAERGNIRAAMRILLQRARASRRITLPVSSQQEMKEVYRDVAGSRLLSSSPVPSTGRQALELFLRLAAAMRPYWEWQGDLTEARYWLREALAISSEESGEETVLAARAKALSEMSRLTCLQNEQREAIALAEESLALWRQLHDPIGMATALLHRGWAPQAMGNNEEARGIYEEAMRALDNTNEQWLRAQLFMYLAASAGFTFDFVSMRSFYTQSRTLFEQLGDKCALADVLKDQGGMLILQISYQEAIDCLLQSITLCKELDQRQYIATGMGWLAIAVGMRGKPDVAKASLYTAQLKGASQSLMDDIGLVPWTKTHSLVRAVYQYIQSQTDQDSWEAAWQAGRKLTMEQAIALAYELGAMTE